MNGPTPLQRAKLDAYIRELARLGDGLKLDEFRESAIQRAARSDRIIRKTLYLFGLSALVTLISLVSFAAQFNNFTWIALWAICLGGLGAVTSLLLHVLKIAPLENAQPPEELDALARIFLGCILSFVLTLALASQALDSFFNLVSGEGSASASASAPAIRAGAGARNSAGSANLWVLFPFLCGYSIPLVLGLLDKASLAITITLGLGERPPARGRRSRG